MNAYSLFLHPCNSHVTNFSFHVIHFERSEPFWSAPSFFFNLGNFYLIISLNNCFCSPCDLHFPWNTYNPQGGSTFSIFHSYHCLSLFPTPVFPFFYILVELLKSLLLLLLFYNTLLVYFNATSAFYCFNSINASLFFCNMFLIYPTILSNMDPVPILWYPCLLCLFFFNPIDDASFW